MTFDTRFFFLIKKFVFKLKQKTYIFKKSFTISFLILLAGFLLGNVFGTFLNILRFFIPWDGFIILLILLILEGISYLTYHKKYNFYTPLASVPVGKTKNQIKSLNVISKTSLNQRNQKDFWTLSKQNIPTYKNLNFLKIGLMFGFFIDAFKVGS
jgi:hypothetical protein